MSSLPPPVSTQYPVYLFPPMPPTASLLSMTMPPVIPQITSKMFHFFLSPSPSTKESYASESCPVSLPPGNTPQYVGNCSILNGCPQQCAATSTCTYKMFSNGVSKCLPKAWYFFNFFIIKIQSFLLWVFIDPNNNPNNPQFLIGSKVKTVFRIQHYEHR